MNRWSRHQTHNRPQRRGAWSNHRPDTRGVRNPATRCLNRSDRPDGHGRTYRRGFTLIEVVAGLALLGTLLVSITLAKGRFTRQRAVADRQIQAIAATESLLAQWWQDLSTFPRQDTGEVPGAADLSWHTSLIDDADAQDAGAVIVRMQINDQRQTESAASLIVIDLALPEVQDAEDEDDDVSPEQAVEQETDPAQEQETDDEL